MAALTKNAISQRGEIERNRRKFGIKIFTSIAEFCIAEFCIAEFCIAEFFIAEFFIAEFCLRIQS